MTILQLNKALDSVEPEDDVVVVVTKSGKQYKTSKGELYGCHAKDNYLLCFWERNPKPINWVCIGLEDVESLNFPYTETDDKK